MAAGQPVRLPLGGLDLRARLSAKEAHHSLGRELEGAMCEYCNYKFHMNKKNDAAAHVFLRHKEEIFLPIGG